MFKWIKDFFHRWYTRLKIFSMFVAIWAVIFSVTTICNFKAGFAYDDTLVFSTPAFQKTIKEKVPHETSDYWKSVNGSYNLERVKVFPYLTAWIFKIFGFKVHVFASRDSSGSEKLVEGWKLLVNEFYFFTDDNQKYETLEKNNFVIFFANSDSDIIQAKKSDVFAVRVMRSKKSVNKSEYNPGKFKEPIMPLSEF